jgi:hypothetical protein
MSTTEAKFAWEITQDDKDEFLRLLYEGRPRHLAARDIGTTATRIKRLCNPLAEHYDEAFAKAYILALNSDEHEGGRLEHLRDLQWQKAEAGDSKMIEKLSLVYDPAWRDLRHQNLRLDVNLAARLLPNVPLDVLERALEMMDAEEKELAETNVLQLPSGDTAA